MLLRVMSDLHLEFDYYYLKRFKFDDVWEPLPLPSDPETVLVLAGDVWNKFKMVSHRGRSWITKMSERFRHVVFVPGNHDYWTANLDTLVPRMREMIAARGLTNVHVLQNSSVVIDDFRFFGSTLWTDMNRGDPLTTMSFAFTMSNDHKKIRHGESFTRMKHWDWTSRHLRAVQELRTSLIEHPEKTIVVSHHAPCTLSLDPRYAADTIANGFYASDLTNLMFDNPHLLLWTHGHIHYRTEYLIGNTRVMCNPRGYFMQNDHTGFVENQVVDTSSLDPLQYFT